MPGKNQNSVGSSELLKEFGRYLQRQRAQKGLNQARVAASLRPAKGGFSQGRIAQVEAGRVPHLNDALIRDLAKAYQAHEVELRAEYLGDRYKLPKAHVELLKRDVLDVKGLAEWEKGLPQNSHFWVVAPNFVDTEPEHREIRDAVVTMLKKDCVVSYFIKEEDTVPNNKFHELLIFFRFNESLRGSGGEVRWYPLTPSERRLMMASFVIAHPDSVLRSVKEPRPKGYMVISADGKPTFGIEMGEEDLRNCVSSVTRLIGEKDHAEGLIPNPDDDRAVLDPSLPRTRSWKARSSVRGAAK